MRDAQGHGAQGAAGTGLGIALPVAYGPFGMRSTGIDGSVGEPVPGGADNSRRVKKGAALRRIAEVVDRASFWIKPVPRWRLSGEIVAHYPQMIGRLVLAGEVPG